MSADPFDLARFRDAQDPVWERVVAELSAGRKTTHWMWFVFPQIEGLSRSGMGRRYAIASVAEARAYLADPVLGPRLREAAGLVLHPEKTARAVMGAPDDAKLVSSMTLFEAVAEAPADRRLFAGVIDWASGGARCTPTREWLAEGIGEGTGQWAQ